MAATTTATRRLRRSVYPSEPDGGQHGDDGEDGEADSQRAGEPEHPAEDGRGQEPQPDEPAHGPHEQEGSVRPGDPGRGRRTGPEAADAAGIAPAGAGGP